MSFGTSLEMQRAWVNFFGVCTHFPQVPDPSNWRVVLPNASKEVIDAHPPLKKKNICPHAAHLQLLKEQVVSIEGDAPFDADYMLDLKGVTLQITNSTMAAPVKDYTGCSPRLSQWLSGVGPGPAVTAADPKSAACYFDFSGGHLRGTKVDKACVLLLTTTTLGNPQLRITPFLGGKSTLVTLRNPKVEGGLRLPVCINVMNHPTVASQDPNHFLLHYLAADGFPPGDVDPAVIGCETNPSIASGFLELVNAESAGCSNATHPHS